LKTQQRLKTVDLAVLIKEKSRKFSFKKVK
jgi:hypothetical protein